MEMEEINKANIWLLAVTANCNHCLQIQPDECGLN